MRTIKREQVVARVRLENPWWDMPHEVLPAYRDMRARAYLEPFMELLREKVRRAVVLLGPRRVGKTVMIHHAIRDLLKAGVPARSIWYVSVDHPIYNGLHLDELLSHCQAATGTDPRKAPAFVFFDEIQYLRDWEVHLKTLVDTYPALKCTASGSAAAALRLKSNESGAGRFTDFLLPPLTFHEYLDLLGKGDLVQVSPANPADSGGDGFFETPDIGALNQEFIRYLNVGGYPEALFAPAIQSDPARFIKSDIIDKVLLRDLPSLYGIEDIQELNSLFTTLAYNTAGEVSLGELAKGSGVAKNTLKRYIEYLEAAFLIRVVHRIDKNARRFTRATSFKVYLTNPSMRSALFSPVGAADTTSLGFLAETAVFSQWFHSDLARLHYARWTAGEVDIVYLDQSERPAWTVEVKWSDRCVDRPGELTNLVEFCHDHNLRSAVVTTVSRRAVVTHQSVQLMFVPASLYCFTIGYNVVRHKGGRIHLGDEAPDPAPPMPLE